MVATAAAEAGKGKGKASPPLAPHVQHPPTTRPSAQAPPPKAKPAKAGDTGKAKAKVTPPASCPPTYTAAAVKPKLKVRPSLVLSLTSHTLAWMLQIQAAVLAPHCIQACNEALESDPRHANVWVSAAK